MKPIINEVKNKNMEQVVKFRGKVVNHDPMTNPENGWVEGYYLQDLDNDVVKYYIFNCPMRWEVVFESVGQFIGLHDKNGKEIYEGDIICNKEIGGYGLQYFGVVRYCSEDCCFGIDITVTYKFPKRIPISTGECSIDDGHCTIKYTNEYEVIGNIYDNPELLKNL